MSNSVSPLQAIHHQETVLKHRLEAARQQAEAGLQAAREEARRMVAQAEQEGQAEAQAFFEQGLEAARLEAEAILSVAQAEAVALHNKVAPGLDEVAQQILKLVLPGNSEKVAGSQGRRVAEKAPYGQSFFGGRRSSVGGRIEEGN